MMNFGNNGEYVALIGDVVRSREIEERPLFQRNLAKVIQHINDDRIGNGLVSPLELSQGDEVQALFQEPSGVVNVILTLSDSLYPQRFLFGLGRGTLATGLLETTVAMDGPCFLRARMALERCRKQDSWLVADGFGRPFDEVITSSFRLLGVLRKSWTARQHELVCAARKEPQYKVADRFSVVPSVVSESLKAANFGAVTKAEAAISHLLKIFGQETENARKSAKKAKVPNFIDRN